MLDLHPLARGVPKTEDSPFVRILPGGGLSIFRVLLEPGADPAYADVVDLPRDTRHRPSVYCPFCGRKGHYAHTDTYHHFSHSEDQKECSIHDLETALHLRAKKLLIEQISQARQAGHELRATVTCSRCKGLCCKGVCKPKSWDKEEAERTLADGLRPDVTLLTDDKPTFIIEIFVTHLVDAEKVARLNSAGLVGLELTAADLFDANGEETWVYTRALPKAVNSWGLESSPRSFNVCTSCRAVSDGVRVTAKLADSIAATDPQAWGSVLSASGLPGPWRLELAKSAGRIITTLTKKPEELRDKDGLAIGDIDPDVLQAKLFSGLKLHFGDSAVTYWDSLEELASELFKPLAMHVLDSAQDIGGKMESLGKGDKALRQALEIAEMAHRSLSSHESDFRSQAWIGYALLRNSYSFYNTCMLEKGLINWPGSMIFNLTQAQLDGWLADLAKKKIIARFKDGNEALVALHSLASKERGIVFELKRIGSGRRKALPLTKAPIHSTLTPKQIQAIKEVSARSVTIVHGAAGTGKSRLIEGVTRALPQIHWILLAPTGKAANRLRSISLGQQNCAPPMTFHKFMAGQQDGAYLQDEGITFGAVLDECGFVSVEDFERLLKSLNRLNLARLVLVGDPKQLPSIGPGSVLADMIKWATAHPKTAVAEVELTNVVRSGPGTTLTAAANAVRKGRVPTFGPSVTIETPQANLVEQTVTSVLSLGEESGLVQVISGTRKMVRELNVALQGRLNATGRPLSSEPDIRIGDVVICQENYYGDIIMLNGQQAVVVGETEKSLTLDSEGSELQLPVDEVSRLALGYALTIHKAQGSEWDSVVVVIPGAPPKKKGSGFVKRPLVYTALTRSKNRVHIVSRLDTLRAAIQAESFRKTALLYFLKKNW